MAAERPFRTYLKEGRKRAKIGRQVDLAARLRDLGYEIADDTPKTWEAPSGRDPGREYWPGLEELFGEPVPVVMEPGEGTLAEAIRDLAKQMGRLVDAMEQDREDGPPWVDALVAALGALREGSGNGGSDAQHESVVPRPGR